jgi:MFS family permease
MLKLFKSHRYMIFFGVLMISFSAPGQTFLISWFVNPMFNDLNISRSLFAGMYSLATLLASLFLSPMGRVIDKVSPKRVVTVVVLSMTFGCFLIAVSTHYWSLFLGFFIVRLFGQGVLVLTVSSFIIKSYQANRGKMMGIVTLGYPLSELIYPGLALLLLHQFGWRATYYIFTASNIFILLPLALYLLKKSGYTLNSFFKNESINKDNSIQGDKQYVLKEAVKEPSFYVIIIASCVPPVLMTGLLFHQESIFALNNWPIGLAASGLALYAILKAVGAILVGGVVDRIGPLWPFVILILLLATGAAITGIGGPTYTIFIYFGLVGFALGISAPVMNVIWPNMYGTLHIGSIKGFIGTFRNGLTALGPLPIALAIDNGYSLKTLLLFTACGVSVIASFPIIVSLFNKKLNKH